jgi:hypothetical protein
MSFYGWDWWGLFRKKTQLVPKRKDFFRNEEILNTRGDQAFSMGAKKRQIESAHKSAETGRHQILLTLLRCVSRKFHQILGEFFVHM